MKEVTIKFTAEEGEAFDEAELQRHIKADDAFGALWDISQEIFRPARKHGYSDAEINRLIELSGTYEHEKWGQCSVGAEIVSLLERKFYAILEEKGINLDELYL